MSAGRKQIRIAVRFPDARTADARAGGASDFTAFERVARTAERGLLDFLLLDEGHGPYTDNGRPEPITVLSALAARTDRIGLAATADTTANEPCDLARRLASLDHLSDGRAAWNAVTRPDALAGVGSGRGGLLDRDDRRTRAAEFVATARELWDSWTPDGTPRPLSHSGRHFTVNGEFTVPRSPQGHPVVLHSGDDEAARESAASAADVILTEHRTPEAARDFYADTKGRLAAYGREADDLLVLSAVTVVLGEAEAPGSHRPTRGQYFAGTAQDVAASMDEFVSNEAADGFLLVPRSAPGDLDDFVGQVVPLLQERGVFRTEYAGSTLRSRLGLAEPVWKG